MSLLKDPIEFLDIASKSSECINVLMESVHMCCLAETTGVLNKKVVQSSPSQQVIKNDSIHTNSDDVEAMFISHRVRIMLQSRSCAQQDSSSIHVLVKERPNVFAVDI